MLLRRVLKHSRTKRNFTCARVYLGSLQSHPGIARCLLLLLLLSVHGHALVVGHLPVVLVVPVVLVPGRQLLLLLLLGLHGVLGPAAVLLLVTVDLSIDGLAGKNLQ